MPDLGSASVLQSFARPARAPRETRLLRDRRRLHDGPSAPIMIRSSFEHTLTLRAPSDVSTAEVVRVQGIERELRRIEVAGGQAPEAPEVRLIRGRHDVEILRRAREPMRADRKSTDEHVVNPAVGQRGDQLIRREHPSRDRGSPRARMPCGSAGLSLRDAQTWSARGPAGDPPLAPPRCDEPTRRQLSRPASSADRNRRRGGPLRRIARPNGTTRPNCRRGRAERERYSRAPGASARLRSRQRVRSAWP